MIHVQVIATEAIIIIADSVGIDAVDVSACGYSVRCPVVQEARALDVVKASSCGEVAISISMFVTVHLLTFVSVIRHRPAQITQE